MNDASTGGRIGGIEMATTPRDKLPRLKNSWTTYAYPLFAVTVAVLLVWGMIIAGRGF
jgi:hypothetical protein